MQKADFLFGNLRKKQYLCGKNISIMLFESQIKEFIHRFSYWHKQKAKEEMRNLLEEKRRILTKEQVSELSASIIERLKALPEFESAKVVLAYYPIRNEVNTRPLLEEYRDKKIILLPVSRSRSRMELRQYMGRDNLRRGKFGIPEPQGRPFRGHVDLVVVPGVGFDERKHRIGRGGGYYDRFLSKNPFATKVAVAYDFQLVTDVPVDSHDKKVDIIVTPSRVIR